MRKLFGKRIFLLAAILFAAVCFCCSCGKPVIEEAGIYYGDPEIDMYVSVFDSDWIYAKDRDLGQVYFFIEDDETFMNVISVSSQPAESDIASQTEHLWEHVKENMDSAPFAVEYGAVTDTMVGRKHEGRIYNMTLDDSSYGKISSMYVFWSAGEKIYILSSTALGDNTEKVSNAVSDILETFLTESELP